MTYTVTMRSSISAVDERWDSLMEKCDAPVFFRRAFLRAFEQYPLHPIKGCIYLLVETSRGELVSGFPAYLQTDVDPMNVLRDHYPQASGRPSLLSHVWHCYDTILPVDPTHPEATFHAIRAFKRYARECGAYSYGFVNVDSSNRLANTFAEVGIPGIDIDTGWTLSIADLDDFESYLHGRVGRKPRKNLSRDLRKSEDAHIEVRINTPDSADLDGFVQLARRTAAKHNNADYYQQGAFQHFIKSLGDVADLIEIRENGNLAASAITLHDRTRAHYWCVGYDQDRATGYSPFYVAFAHVMRHALSSGRESFECGRRNSSFKRRYGLRPRTLRAYVAQTSP